MIKSAQYHRLLWMTLLVIIAFCGLGWRLVDLQYLTADDTWKEFKNRSDYETIEMPWRGEITDREGTALATSVRHYNLGVDPRFNGSLYRELAKAVAPVLKIPELELAERIRPRQYVDSRSGKTNDVLFVSIAKEVPHDTWIQVQKVLGAIGEDWDVAALTKEQRTSLRNIRKRGVYVDLEVQTRHYPNGAMAAPILGLVNSREYRSPEGKGATYSLQFGANGIEQVLDRQLSGTPGRSQILRTELVEQVTERFAARDGANVALTIDRRIQEGTDEAVRNALVELGAKSVFITVLDVKTGEILALSSAPSFDPGDRSTFKPEYSRLLPLTETFEPGSLMKAIPIAGALENNVVSLTTTIFCENGYWSEPSSPLTDTHPYGDLPVISVVTKSSNIGTAKITAMLGPDRFYQFLVDFGIGRKTGIGLYEEAGLLKPRDSYKPVDFTRLPIGYASAVTQLQIASVYAAIANGGVLMRPQILRRVEERDGTVILDFKPQPVRRVISQRTSRDVMEALETVTGPGGTATTAALDYYTVAGKTGTAHKYTGDPDAPYDNKRYYGSFVGVFPASAPRICVAVTVNEPDKNKVGHYGGQVAGPLFVTVANMIGRHLNIQPDKSPNSTDQTQMASLEETEP